MATRRLCRCGKISPPAPPTPMAGPSWWWRRYCGISPSPIPAGPSCCCATSTRSAHTRAASSGKIPTASPTTCCPISARWASASSRSWGCLATTTPPRMAQGCATTSMWWTLPSATSRHWHASPATPASSPITWAPARVIRCWRWSRRSRRPAAALFPTRSNRAARAISPNAGPNPP